LEVQAEGGVRAQEALEADEEDCVRTRGLETQAAAEARRHLFLSRVGSAIDDRAEDAKEMLDDEDCVRTRGLEAQAEGGVRAHEAVEADEEDCVRTRGLEVQAAAEARRRLFLSRPRLRVLALGGGPAFDAVALATLADFLHAPLTSIDVR